MGSKSHQQFANYCKTASFCVKPFIGHYDYQTGSTFTADETYIKIRGAKGYVRIIMDASKRSIISYQASDNHGVGPCILAMWIAFQNLKKLLENFRFIADGYSAYPLAAQPFYNKYGNYFKFEVTQVIGLTIDDAVSTEFRPFRQIILSQIYRRFSQRMDLFFLVSNHLRTTLCEKQDFL